MKCNVYQQCLLTPHLRNDTHTQRHPYTGGFNNLIIDNNEVIWIPVGVSSLHSHQPEHLFMVGFMLPRKRAPVFVCVVCYCDPEGVMWDMSRDCVKFKCCCVCVSVAACVCVISSVCE